MTVKSSSTSYTLLKEQADEVIKGVKKGGVSCRLPLLSYSVCCLGILAFGKFKGERRSCCWGDDCDDRTSERSLALSGITSLWKCRNIGDSLCDTSIFNAVFFGDKIIGMANNCLSGRFGNGTELGSLKSWTISGNKSIRSSAPLGTALSKCTCECFGLARFLPQQHTPNNNNNNSITPPAIVPPRAAFDLKLIPPPGSTDESVKISEE